MKLDNDTINDVCPLKVCSLGWTRVFGCLKKVLPAGLKASDKNLPPMKGKAVAFWNFTPIETDSHGSN